MPTSSPPDRKGLTFLSILALLFATAVPAQTLAHRNWAGSGLTASHWWRNAIFYRVDPTHFQDSDNDGTGDLRGLSLRLDYLQSLGVDALILSSPNPSDPGFDDLLAAASQRHLRLIVALRSTPSVNLLAAARSWLTRGAAGIELLATDPNTDQVVDTLTVLHTLTRTFPGERIVLAGFDHPLSAPPPKGADLLDTPITLSPFQIPQLSPNTTPTPLLLTDQINRSATTNAIADTPAAALSLDETAAILLLTTPGPISLLYGQELGLQQPLDATMQWTPTNLTPPNFTEPNPEPTEPTPTTPPPPHRPDPNVYGAFVPYVPPKISKPTPTVFDPNNLRGFTTNPTAQSAGAPRNAAEEDRDPKSLLNFYRRLIQLHHDNLTLRSGAVVPLHHDNILAWLRVLPSAARTNPPILIVCNPTDHPISFDPTNDMAPYHARHLAFRTLLTSAPLFTIETTESFTLPAHTVYIGELYR
ncbi:MAG: hypothetical protein V4555_07045 [Acidobacteriota bacterium]